jgi:monovalent cation:H+ antiporter, CPA1 family
MLLIVSISVIAISKKLLRIPYPIALVITGLIIGLLKLPYLSGLKEFVSQEEIFGFIIISIFLPILLEEASLKLSYSYIKENLKPILLLAVPGTLITFIVVGFSSNLILGLNSQIAFTFAALMSAQIP